MYECSKELAARLKIGALIDGHVIVNGTLTERMRLSNMWLGDMDRMVGAWRHAVQHACGLQDRPGGTVDCLEANIAEHMDFVRQKIHAVLAMRAEKAALE